LVTGRSPSSYTASAPTPFSGARRCVALDLPLHGRSPAQPDQDWSLGALADVVSAVCDELGLAQVDLVGHDTGGALAQIVAARRPSRIRTLTLTNCEVHDNVPPAAFRPTVDAAREGAISAGAPTLLADLAMARAAAFAMGYEHDDEPGDAVVRAFLEPLLGTPAAARQFEDLLVALGPRDLLAVGPALARLHVPTLVVWGTGDEFFDLSWAYWLGDLIPGVTGVVELPGAKLFFPDERADELVPLLRRHWAAPNGRLAATRRAGAIDA
jgi:pimeloyl-ACP methyl ester carboxylesterase